MNKRHSSVDSKISRPSSNPKKSLPPISSKAREVSQQITRMTPQVTSPEFNFYVFPNEKSQTFYDPQNIRKFFNQTPRETGSISPKCRTAGICSKSVNYSQDDMIISEFMEPKVKSSGKQTKWEMLERIESYEIQKSQKKSVKSLSSLTEEFELWQQCYDEIIPMMKTHSQESASSVSRINSHMKNLFLNIFEEFKTQNKINKVSKLSLQKQVKELECKILELQGASEELVKSMRIEEEKIKAEIDELFGSDDNEFQHLKQKAKRLYEIQSGATTEVLSELYQEMSKEREIPTLKIFDMNLLNPDELETGLMRKFKILQRSTAHRVLKVFENRCDRSDADCQTYAPYVDPKTLEDANAQIEKLQGQFQAALNNNEKIKGELSNKQSLANFLEQEKTNLANDLIRVKREIDGCMSELINVKRDNELLKSELENLKKENNEKIMENSLMQDKLESQYGKITQLMKNIEKLEFSVKEKEEKLKYLEERKGKKGDNKEQESPQAITEHLRGSSPINSSRNSKRNGSENHSRQTSRDNELNESKLGASEVKRIRQGNKNNEDSGSNYEIDQIDQERTMDHKTIKKRSPIRTKNEYKESSSNNSDSNSTLGEHETLNRKENKFNSTSYSRDQTNSESARPLSKLSTDTNNSQSTIVSSHRPRHNQLTKVEEAQYETSNTNLKSDKIKINIPAQSPKNKNHPHENSEETTPSSPNKPKFKINKNPQSSSQVNDEDFSMRWENHSIPSSEPPHEDYLKPVPRIKIGENGNSVSVTDVAVMTTSDLKMKDLKELSIGVQYNWENPDADIESENTQDGGNFVYLLPYNPNNVYGLRGDTYFHTTNKSFYAQPVIPELKDSMVFQSSYIMDDAEKSFERSRLRHNKRLSLDRVIVKNSQ
ncbi:unnamed protein product [Blepharisma stoltei]|uniref:Uncharacterized protein n=1 Tax=Blepharisma stoltei TaxID=1481888 RepID=A0AAU9J073_9CILI|nr:unnamed protein product [Blepharisma stoltei]